MADILIRGGSLLDGDGGGARRADVRIRGQFIREVAPDLKPAPDEQVLDAGGLTVTPGFVDVHTHYDGQATWDERLAPSCWHGVTSLVMGNCGVGFAPVRPGRQDELIEIMEGVEDIPGTALHEGMTWGWETFGDYLNVLGERRWTVDVGTHVPHAAVRTYVMGARAAEAPAAAEEIAQMCELVREGVRAGALGVSVTRMLAHRSIRGEVVPGTFAAADELLAMAGVLKDLGTGVFEVVPRGMDGDASEEAHAEMAWMEQAARESGRPVVFSLVQTHTEKDRFRVFLEESRALREQGVPIYPEVSSRPTGVLFGLQSAFTPFSTRPSYKALEHLPLAQRVAAMRQPEVRARILAEPNGAYRSEALTVMHANFANMFRVESPIDWEPSSDETLAALARKAGVTAEAYCYDFMLGDGGRNLILYPYTNYSYFRMDEVREMLAHPTTLFGLGDGGAHCGIACDAGNTTLALAFWTRDRSRGPRLDPGALVRKMSRDNAEIYGLNDRGRVAPGYRADLNVMDLEALDLLLPEMAYDLPGGARRMLQRATGYVATYVAGERTIANDELTGALPGRLIRGARPAPA